MSDFPLLTRRYISMFDTAIEGLWIMTPQGEVSFYNNSFYDQFDIDLNSATLDNWLHLIHPEDQQPFSSNVDQHIEQDDKSEQQVISQYRVRKKDGSYCWIEAIGVMTCDEEGEYMVGNHRDITKQKKLEQSIRRLAFFDKVSGLPNQDQLKHDISRRAGTITLVHIHLDRLKSYINQYGETIIQETINRTVRCLEIFQSYACRLYRTAPDTFSVLIADTISETLLAQLCADFIHTFRCQSAESDSMYIEDVSLGAYTCDDLALDSKAVITWASQTWEYATQHEPKRWAICNREVQKKVERYFYIERNLKSAIENDELSIRLQPIICAKTHKLLSFEALARWEQSNIGEIYPDEFVPAAERRNLIGPLGKMILTQACSFIAYYNKIWKSQTRINVNISVLQLLKGDFAQSAYEIVTSEGIMPQTVMLEVTESVMLDDNLQAIHQLEQLRAKGFALAMDDFGAGYSSVTGFYKLPFQSLKIDRALVNESMKYPEPLAYLQFLTSLCRDRGIQVTVEGIETEQMMTTFAELDVSSLQGYWFSRPLPLEQALKQSTDHYQA